MPRFHVRRSTLVEAPLADIYSTVADYSTWPAWSPWLVAEPDAEVTISPKPQEIGASYSWKGDLVGEGTITHLHLEPDESVRDEIRFAKPFRSRADVWFEIRQTHEGNLLAWNMEGKLPWFLFWMKSQMETFIGMDYERGLKMLKEYIETGEVKAETRLHGLVDVEPVEIVGIRQRCHRRELSEKMPPLFHQVHDLLEQAGLEHGRGASVYHHFDCKSEEMDFTSGFECNAPLVDLPEGLSLWSLPATQAIRVEQIGPYEHLGNAWSAAHQFLRYRKLKENPAGSFEVYQNDPETTPANELKTDVYVTVKS
ncbi:SRPBCC family protein [Rubinisphaera sp. JC750]|uniref:SRPBCC family protein n=1 Tax=Rubinisphaera sp. JC750 TaxID=2898658 RepID=UPI001F2C2058|nr:GyrI-like domain-containing protein [Rubinisphaera sp. JC750]